MGVSEWASRMTEKIQQEYGVTRARAIQIPDRVRKLVANPDIKAMKEAELITQDFTTDVTQDLIALLNQQDTETLEGRWNSLAKERGVYDIVGADALLYDPAKAGLDPDKELISDDGESITIRESMITAWREEIPIEAIPQGIQLGNTEFRTKGGEQMTLSEDNDGFDEDGLNDQLDRDLRSSRFEVDADLLALEDVDFPMEAPRQDCVLTIAAVRRYILEHGGASREEILDAMEPEENYPLGTNGVQARAKGFECEFRHSWWEEVVAPGLRSFPEIKEPVRESGKWLSNQATA